MKYKYILKLRKKGHKAVPPVTQEDLDKAKEEYFARGGVITKLVAEYKPDNYLATDEGADNFLLNN